MGNPLSPVLANIFMSKLETDLVQPLKPAFYDRYIDDCFSKRKKNAPDELFEQINIYHPNSKFIVEESPARLLVHTPDDKFKWSVLYKKPSRFPTHWRSEIPIKWKRNFILGDLYKGKCISTNFCNRYLNRHSYNAAEKKSKTVTVHQQDA